MPDKDKKDHLIDELTNKTKELKLAGEALKQSEAKAISDSSIDGIQNSYRSQNLQCGNET